MQDYIEEKVSVAVSEADDIAVQSIATILDL